MISSELWEYEWGELCCVLREILCMITVEYGDELVLVWGFLGRFFEVLYFSFSICGEKNIVWEDR